MTPKRAVRHGESKSMPLHYCPKLHQLLLTDCRISFTFGVSGEILGYTATIASDSGYCYRRSNVVRLFVCQSVILSVGHVVSPAKTPEPIEVLFGG